MEELYGKYLPIGSIVLLKEGKKRLMITGFCAVPNEDNSKQFDYSGCLYPEGIISTDKIALFNHDQIAQIFSVGYSDNEEIEFKKRLNDLVDKVNNGN